MNMSSLIYRPRQRWHIWCAFTGAIVLHVAAIALARSELPLHSAAESSAFDIPIEGEMAPQPPPEPIDMSTPPPLTADQSIIQEENPAQILQRSPRTVLPIVRPAANGQHALTSVKAFALSAPRPSYPYEARRQRITGSGVALLAIDQTAGRVTNVSMSQSTGVPSSTMQPSAHCGSGGSRSARHQLLPCRSRLL
jgi:hypothetical protein